MSEQTDKTTTLIHYAPDGSKTDTVVTQLPSEITLLRARGYRTEAEFEAVEAAAEQKAKADEEAKAKAAAEKKADEQQSSKR